MKDFEMPENEKPTLILTDANKVSLPNRVNLPAPLPEDEVEAKRAHLMRLSEEKRQDRRRTAPPKTRDYDRKPKKQNAQSPFFIRDGKIVNRARDEFIRQNREAATGKIEDKVRSALIDARLKTRAGKESVVCIYRGMANAAGYNPPYSYSDSNLPDYKEKMEAYKQEWLLATRVKVEPLDRDALRISANFKPKTITFKLDGQNNYLPVEMEIQGGETVTLYGQEIVNADRTLAQKAAAKKEQRRADGQRGNEMAAYINSDKVEDLSDTFGKEVIFAPYEDFAKGFDVFHAYSVAKGNRTALDRVLFREPAIVRTEDGLAFYPNRRHAKNALADTRAIPSLPKLSR